MTNILARNDALPVIVLCLNNDNFRHVMHAYGLPDAPVNVYPVYSLDDAYAVSMGLGNGTPWCVTRDDLAAGSTAKYLSAVYGAPATVAEALQVQNIGTAINPRLLQ